MVAMKKYIQLPSFTLFQTTHKKCGIPSPYEKLMKANLRDWFTPNGEVKPNYIHAAKLEITKKQNKRHLLIFEKHPKL
jgi:hypothetical protein